jgi:recombination protein RecT
MNNQVAAAQPPSALVVRRDRLQKMESQFKFALPAHIPVERFLRVINTALQNNPDLLKCAEQSFFNACMKAAQDGLLPDGREAALAPYRSEGQLLAQYLPMIAGIRKKVRNSGVLADWNVQVVQEGDEFDYQLGDNPFIHHKPAERGGRDRPVRFAYSIATYPDGTKSREVMNIDQLRDIQKKSKAKSGPWSDPVFFGEMCRKTVAKLHSKQLPMSTDLDTLMRRDDELYDFTGAKERAKEAQARRPASVREALDRFSAAAPLPPPNDDVPGAEPEQPDNEIVTSPPAAGGEPAADVPTPPTAGGGHQSVASPPTANVPPVDGGSFDPIRAAYECGREARAKGHQRRAVPPEYRTPERTKEAQAWDSGWTGEPLN